ncbi:probable ATP-dependent RNA helicase DDX10 isoform X2 [Nematostella vectensis]|nr:probable ATP-dependent RNA helicase DDX10 isoform X2 [Nematostella vectensis]
MDGLGALVISPTRELAYQTFEVLVKIGNKHDLSAGLIIGGKDLKNEQKRIMKTNIVVCTPGRLLQHMDETPNFDCTSLQILVLDEADRILDMGFAPTLNAIIENLPSERQTLLYSATQTRSVKDLARLSLQEPTYISAHEKSDTSTPNRLTQSYVVCELPDKLNFLFSFIRNHLKSKILVFVSSCKQVKFIYEGFRRLRPGIPLMALYGKQKQLKRVAIYDEFCKKTQCVLFATDIAARGLDFPAVNWVIQLDCPEDANTYIHRAGRTARYQKDGQSLLVLLPSEEQEMIKALKDKKVPINEIKVNPKKMSSIQSKLESFLAQDQELKHWAQKSIISYVRSVFLQSNKKIFDTTKLPIKEFSVSLGLSNAPRIRFLQKAEKRFGGKQTSEPTMGDVDIGDSSDEEEPRDKSQDHPPYTVRESNEPDFTGIEDTVDQDGDADMLFVKRRNVEVEPLDFELDQTKEKKKTKKEKMPTKVSHAKKLVNKKLKLNSKITFNDDGKPESVEDGPEARSEPGAAEEPALEPVPLGAEHGQEVGGISVEESRKLLSLEDKKDRHMERERIRSQHTKKRLKEKRKRKEQKGETVAMLETGGDELSDEQAEDYIGQRPTKKRKAQTELTVPYEEDDQNASLVEDEELALHLLNGT